MRSIVLVLPFQGRIRENVDYSNTSSVFSVLRNFDDVLRICCLNYQPFLAEAWPTWSGF